MASKAKTIITDVKDLGPGKGHIDDRDENAQRHGHIGKGHVNAIAIEKGIEMEGEFISRFLFLVN